MLSFFLALKIMVVICLEQGAYGQADATTTPSFLASLKSRMVFTFSPFWCRFAQVVL